MSADMIQQQYGGAMPKKKEDRVDREPTIEDVSRIVEEAAMTKSEKYVLHQRLGKKMMSSIRDDVKAQEKKKLFKEIREYAKQWIQPDAIDKLYSGKRINKEILDWIKILENSNE